MNTEPDCIKLLGERRRGETFEVGGHRYVDFLSHGTVLEDCTITIQGSSRSVVFHGATFRGCTIRAKRRFQHFSWHDVALDQCHFKGWFIGCDFGPRPDTYPDHPRGEVSCCDFGQARLHACRFFRADMSRITLPGWTCFTVLEPERNAADWLSIPFPDSYRRVEQQLIAQAVEGWRVEGVAADCQSATEVARKHDISAEEIKVLVSGRSYIHL
jgi:hypothetical protein